MSNENNPDMDRKDAIINPYTKLVSIPLDSIMSSFFTNYENNPDGELVSVPINDEDVDVAEIDTAWEDEADASYIVVTKAVEVALSILCKRDRLTNELLMMQVTEETKINNVMKLLDDIIETSEANIMAWLKAMTAAREWTKTKGPEVILKWICNILHQSVIAINVAYEAK
jgi:hypothetical protein